MLKLAIVVALAFLPVITAAGDATTADYRCTAPNGRVFSIYLDPNGSWLRVTLENGDTAEGSAVRARSAASRYTLFVLPSSDAALGLTAPVQIRLEATGTVTASRGGEFVPCVRAPRTNDDR